MSTNRTAGRLILQINDFLKAGIILTTAMRQGEGGLRAPQMVIDAFITELTIKCLLELRGNSTRGHSISKLFIRLPSSDQEAIREIHRQLGEKHGRNEEECDAYFDQALAESSENFVNIRYVYEKDGGLEAYDLGPIALACYRYIFQIEPRFRRVEIEVDLTH